MIETKNISNVTLFTADAKPLIQENAFSQLLQKLPTSLHARALRYKSELSAYNFVVGRLLLKHGLVSFNLNQTLEDIHFLENEKPFLLGIDFNISHSDNQVVCAFSCNGPIGVDVEKVKPIDFGDFTAMFTSQEWSLIKNSKNPLHSFYWFWTRKESIIKALGLKLSFLHEIELDVSPEKFVVGNKTWFLKEIDVGESFVGAICIQEEKVDVDIVKVSF